MMKRPIFGGEIVVAVRPSFGSCSHYFADGAVIELLSPSRTGARAATANGHQCVPELSHTGRVFMQLLSPHEFRPFYDEE